MLRTLRYQYLAIIWSIIILVLCNLPTNQLSGVPVPFFEGFDKLAHTGFFFVLSVFLFYGKIRQQGSYEYRFITILKIFFISATLGGFIEFMQWEWFTYRSAEWWDFFCDLLGVAMGTFSYVFLHRLSFHENKA